MLAENQKSNDSLKSLYDASVSFKNDLANLRGNIKSLNRKTNAMASKCSEFQNELDELFELNKSLVEEQRKGAKSRDGTTSSANVRLELDHKHKQMKQMQDSLVNLISIQPLNVMSRDEKH